MSIKIGQTAPHFKTDALQGKEFVNIDLADFKGKWVCLFFYPLDFTFVCPTEIVEFNNNYGEFQDRECEILGASIDSVYSHLGWANAKEELSTLRFPLLSDLTKDISRNYGVLDESKGFALRGTFIIDPEQNIRWININDAAVGRSVEETLRVLDALQTDELCPCGWEKGQETIKL
jgi:peroxiredoxin (alkyl hydroperoxide reductase subunit C)